MKIFWGFVLLMFGVAYLGAGLNWWGYGVPNSLWQFWPLIFVFWGLDLLTHNTSFYIPVMIIAVILSGAFIYLTYYNNANNLNWPGFNTPTVQHAEFSSTLPKDATKGEVTVSTGAIEFGITGGTDKLLEGVLDSNFAKPELSESTLNGLASATLSTVNISGGTNWWSGYNGTKNNLSMKLNEKVPINLIIKSGASRLDLDLTRVNLSGLSIDTGASSLNVKIGEKVLDGTKVSVSAGASSVDFSIPKSIGVKITSTSGLSSRSFEGYAEKDGAFYSEGYDGAVKKIEVNFKVGVSSLKVGN